MLADDQPDLVLLDEPTYMVAYDYLPLEAVLSALRERPAHQSVITGRGCHRDIIENGGAMSASCAWVKHAFDAGIGKRRWGLTTEDRIRQKEVSVPAQNHRNAQH